MWTFSSAASACIASTALCSPTGLALREQPLVLDPAEIFALEQFGRQDHLRAPRGGLADQPRDVGDVAVDVGGEAQLQRGDGDLGHGHGDVGEADVALLVAHYSAQPASQSASACASQRHARRTARSPRPRWSSWSLRGSTISPPRTPASRPDQAMIGRNLDRLVSNRPTFTVTIFAMAARRTASSGKSMTPCQHAAIETRNRRPSRISSRLPIASPPGRAPPRRQRPPTAGSL